MYLTYIPTYTYISSPNFNLKCLFLKLTGFPVMIGFPVRYVTGPLRSANADDVKNRGSTVTPAVLFYASIFFLTLSM